MAVGDQKAEDQSLQQSCDKALQLSTQEIDLLKEALSKESEYGNILRDQRNKAIEAGYEKNSPPALPWYVWTVFGAAGGVLLLRGIK